MRILCLHGYGTSGAILKGQLEGVIRQADASYEFVFLDGEYQCPEAPGIGKFIQGPFLCFNRSFGPADTQSALDYLQAFIDDEGPFDGILGFSHGGSLALTYLLREAESSFRESDSDPDSDAASTSSLSTGTFKFAIILSTIVAFSPDPGYCSDLLSDLTEVDRSLLRNFPHEHPNTAYNFLSEPPSRAVFFELLGRLLFSSFQAGLLPLNTDLGLSALTQSSNDGVKHAMLKVPRMLHPQLIHSDVRIRIPTVHIVGQKDVPELVELSKMMQQLCEERSIRVLAHDGGHTVPHGPKDVKALWKAVEWAANEGMRQAF